MTRLTTAVAPVPSNRLCEKPQGQHPVSDEHAHRQLTGLEHRVEDARGQRRAVEGRPTRSRACAAAARAVGPSTRCHRRPRVRRRMQHRTARRTQHVLQRGERPLGGEIDEGPDHEAIEEVVVTEVPQPAHARPPLLRPAFPSRGGPPRPARSSIRNTSRLLLRFTARFRSRAAHPGRITKRPRRRHVGARANDPPPRRGSSLPQ